MRVLILQDHTDFFERMWLSSLDHHIGLPLTVSVLDAVRQKLIVCKVRGQLKTLSEVEEMLRHAAPGAESTLLGRAIAAGVEGVVEAWYCIADDEGAEWLTNNHAGPVLRWNGAVWWGKLKGITITAEVVTHESFKPRRNKPRKRKDAQEDAARPLDAGGYRVRRPDVQPIG